MSEPVNGADKSVLQAVNEEGEGVVRRNSPLPEDEAARLAAAQAERLAKRAAAAETAKPEVLQAPAAPRVVAQLHVAIYDTGEVKMTGPINDPTQFFNLITQALYVLHNHTVTMVQQATERRVRAEAKVPFMQRMFQKRAAAKTPQAS